MGFERHYEALLAMADIMVHHRSLPELFSELAKRLHEVTAFELASCALHDPEKQVMRLHIWEGTGSAHVPVEIPVESSPSGWVWQNQQPMVVGDLQAEENFAPVFRLFREMGLRSYCVMPLTTAQGRLGALGLGSSRVNAYQEDDLRLLRRVAELAAVAVENSLTRQALHEEKERLHTLLQINRPLVSSLDLRQLFAAISESLQRAMRVDYASLALYEPEANSLRVYPHDLPPEGTEAAYSIAASDSIAGHALREGKVKFFNPGDPQTEPSLRVGGLFQPGVQSGCCVPLITPKGPLGTLNLVTKNGYLFTPADIDVLNQVASQVAIALDNARAYREIAELKDKLAKEKLYLEDEILSELNFEEIIGESPALKRVLAQAKVVAPSDATALVLGETGTGKELIARAIHRMSSRKDGSFVKLNCAAIPTGLLESELFGHEKGAFTGAISQKIGRLELADKGTLFLDEVGDIPLELQPKLLRVLQDQEFERLGSTRTVRVNIRLIAATNRDLAKSVASREFRSDLFYRLNVFPIRIPPLRERKTDIPMLVRYFVQKFARRMSKHIETIPTETMNALTSWEWPGNVRELENFIERSVILSSGPILTVPLAELRPIYEQPSRSSTLESLEREHIIRTLRETRGVISGAKGAAARLGLKRTTLQSRIQRMGISRADYES
ncbi:MAG TPA: sigma 54-interacting transcriptional regulator [Terriglobales bacterium]|jgi:formate hydrogenlyase transcriptional activator|nr:sigma 54-interacting transcriptional regulator [Terriglobales bacterium]